MKTVACYVRVSTENQLENYSVEEQTERLKAYCRARGYGIYKIYTDGGYSGGNTNRPALRQMISDIGQSQIEAVVVYKLDRLSRSQKDTLTLIEDDFLQNKVDFISVCENFDTTTPFGRAMIGILSVFAQLEKDQITERFTMGRIGRSKAGLFHGGGNAPKGYRYLDGKLIVDDSMAGQIQEIFTRFLSGQSINAISRQMTKAYGWSWNAAVKISNVIKNPVYCGKVRFKGQLYEGVHTPIVPEETYRRANALLSSAERESCKTAAQKTPFRAGYLLSGLIYCSRCGARYSANHGFYKCYSRSKSSPRFVADPDCRNENWAIGDLDHLVMEQIRTLTIPHNLNAVFGTYSCSNPAPQQMKALKKRIADTDRQISKLIDLFQVDKMPVTQISERVAKLQAQKERDQAVLEAEEKEGFGTNRREKFERILKTPDGLEDASMEERRLFVASLIERIEIDGNEVYIRWRS